MISVMSVYVSTMTKIMTMGRLFVLALSILHAVLVLITFSPATRAQSLEMSTVLITGANRGIGLEFARQYGAKGWQVIATCRKPENANDLIALAAKFPDILIEKLDVLDHERIDELAEKYKDVPIDVLINNAGISGGYDNQNFGTIKYEIFDQVMATNFISPLKMAEAFIEHVAASDQKKIINISSMPSSIALTSGRLYIDRPSKTALNMVMRTLSIDVAHRGIIIGLIAPGLVDTDLTQSLDIPKISPEQSVSASIELIDNYTLEMSGSLIQHTGERLPW